MARRRKKNPLLMRIIVITLVAHAIALPIAAHFGAFDKLKQRFGEARVTLIPLPKQAKEKDQAKQHKAKTNVAKAKGHAAVKRGGPAKSDPNKQKVVATNNPNDNASGEGPSIVQGTKTDVGNVPVEKSGPVGTKTVTAPVTTAPVTKSTETAPTPAPATAPPPSAPPVTKPKHVPVYAEPEQDFSPQPTIPDDLRNETLDKDFVAMFTVGSDGIPTDVKMVQSTGNSELDDIALKTAKKWKFKPATLDGSGTESKVKLTIEFKVE